MVSCSVSESDVTRRNNLHKYTFQRFAQFGAQHAAVSLLASLSRLRDDAHLTDVRLIAQAELPPASSRAALEGGAYHEGVLVHRAVLAASSPYFHRLFAEASMSTITIQNVEPHALEAIVEYIYKPDSVVITNGNVQSLLSAASLLQVDGVRAACCSFLLAALAPDNALGIAQIADLHAATDLAAAATHYVHTHAREVLKTEEFLALSSDVLSTLLSSDDLDVPNEGIILEAVIRWVEYDPEKRGAQLAALLEHVRLLLVSSDALQAVLDGPLLRAITARRRRCAPALRDAGVRAQLLLLEAQSYHLLPPKRRAAMAAACVRARPRAPASARCTLLVVGGLTPEPVSDVMALALQGSACGGGGGWEPRAALPERRMGVGLAALGDRVYAVGGYNGDEYVRSVDVYDAGSDSWSAGPPLTEPRCGLGLCALGHVLYAVGGYRWFNWLSSAEMLDVREGVWRAITPMNTNRASVGVAAYNSKVYAVGGFDGCQLKENSSVERYDPITGKWEAVMAMGARRSSVGVGVAAGALWALGGSDGSTVHSSVERYCAGAWTPAAPMACARKCFRVAQLDERLYVVGGDGECGSKLASVAVLDAAQQRWTTLPHDMAIARSDAGVVVFPQPVCHVTHRRRAT